MDAAGKLILSKGVSTTSEEEIAAAAQVAKGTFYLYFDSRDAILAALQRRFMLAFGERMANALAQCRPDNWDARLHAWFKAAMGGLLGR